MSDIRTKSLPELLSIVTGRPWTMEDVRAAMERVLASMPSSLTPSADLD